MAQDDQERILKTKAAWRADLKCFNHIRRPWPPNLGRRGAPSPRASQSKAVTTSIGSMPRPRY